MIVLTWFLIFLGVGNCLEDLPTRGEIELSINRTIEEVERLVNEDPSLPRLSRSQIVDILLNITSTDMKSYEQTVESARDDYRRALMIVLPFSTNSSTSQDLNELYGRAPLTRFVKEKSSETSDDDSGKTELRPYENHREVFSEVTKIESGPSRLTFDLENLGKFATKAFPVKKDVEIVYGKGVTRKTPTMIFHNSDNGFRPTMPTPASTSDVLTSDQWRYNVHSSKNRGNLENLGNRGASKNQENKSDALGKSENSKNRGMSENLGYRGASKNQENKSDALGKSENSRNRGNLENFGNRGVSKNQENKSDALGKSENSKNRGMSENLGNRGASKNQENKSDALGTSENSRNRGNLENLGNRGASKNQDNKSDALGKSENLKNRENFGIQGTLKNAERQENNSDTLGKSENPKNRENSENFGKPGALKSSKNQENNPDAQGKPENSKNQRKSENPENFKNNENLKNGGKPTSRPGEALMYVTPMSTTRSSMGMREEVKDLLASIGLRPEDEGSRRPSTIKEDDHEKIFGMNFRIPETTNLIPGGISGLTTFGEASPSILLQNTFENPPREVRKGVENLSPDVRLLFQRFGLDSSMGKMAPTTTTTTTTTPRTRASFWNNFKPLPSSQVKDEGMRRFLANFGLVEDTRREKSIRDSETSSSVVEAVPGEMRNVLENIGLVSKPKTKNTELPRLENKEHVFKPHETSLEDDKKRQKINKLLDTVRLVQEGKSDVLEVQRAANDLLESTKSLRDSPEALTLEEILRVYNEDVKNQIKRQQDPKDVQDIAKDENSTTVKAEVEKSSNWTDSSVASSDVLTTTTESSSVFKDAEFLGVGALPTETSNLDSLADSFGGSTAAPDPVLPTPRKTGLYFLVDWNTFLEVGEDGPDKVNLRFQPKAGDRTRFIPVTVP